MLAKDKELVSGITDKEAQIEKKTESLKKSYNFIIRINLEKDTVECIHKIISRPVGISYDVVLTLDSANDYFLNNFIMPEDYDKVKLFFKRIVDLKKLENPEDTDDNIQAVYSIKFDDGEIRKYGASVVILDKRNILLCGRDITDARPTQELISMARILKKIWKHYNVALSNFNMEGFIFEVSVGKIYPVFLSDKVCSRMRIREKEFRFISENGIGLDEFVSRLGMNKDSFNIILMGESPVVNLVDENGIKSKYYTRVFASHNKEDIFTVIYSKKKIENIIAEQLLGGSLVSKADEEPSEENGMFIPGKNSRIWIRTFGSFDVFVNGIPIRFTSAKAKELLAVLVDRRGGSLSAEEAISYLWEDKPADKQVMSNYRKVAMRMHETLEEYGIGDLVINNKGIRSLNMAVVDCDLYRFILKDKACTDFFHGQYMQNYSWAERTLATLYQIAGVDYDEG